MHISPFSVTFPPHIFKRFTRKPVLSLVATPGLEECLLQRAALAWGHSLRDEQQRLAGGVDLPLGWPPQGDKPIPTPTVLPATLPAARSNGGDTKQPPNTALQGLKMQHPKQGLKMQSRGGPVRRVGVQTAAAAKAASSPFPPQSPGARANEGTGGTEEAGAAPSRHQCPLPTPTPPRPPQPRPGAAGAGESPARRASGAYLCDSHAETPGRCGGAGAACGGGGRGPPRARGGGGKRSGAARQLWARSPLPAPRGRLGGAWGRALGGQRAGTARRRSPAARR